MPVEFLSDEQAARYGRYHADPNPEQLARFFYLSPQNVRFPARYRRSYTRLGCAVRLGTLRFLGTFLATPTQVPAGVVQTLADQLRVTADGGPTSTPAQIPCTTTRPAWWPTWGTPRSMPGRRFG